MSSEIMRMNMKANFLKDMELLLLNAIINLLSQPNPFRALVCEICSLAAQRRPLKDWAPWIMTFGMAGLLFGFVCSRIILN